jgi:hypothetical protein
MVTVALPGARPEGDEGESVDDSISTAAVKGEGEDVAMGATARWDEGRNGE